MAENKDGKTGDEITTNGAIKNGQPNQKEYLSNLDKINYNLYKNYLFDLKDGYIVTDFNSYNSNGEDKPTKISYESNIRALKVEKWVYDKSEEIADRFKNVFSVFCNNDSNLALVINRTTQGSEVYFILKNETKNNSRNEDSENNIGLLQKAIIGNFPGTTVAKTDFNDCELFSKEKCNSIVSISNVTSQKSENFISQGLEKLLDGIVPTTAEENYSIVILAEPINHKEIQLIRSGYEELASAIAPFAGHQFNGGTSEIKNSSENESLSDSKGTNSSITKTHGVNVSNSTTVSANASIEIPGVGSAGGSASNTTTVGYSYSRGKTEGESTNITNTKGKTYGIAIGETENRTYTYKSYAVTGMLQKIEKQIERINQSEALGMWKFASYVLAEDSKISINVANYLKSLSQGENSYIEASVINEWYWNNEHCDNTANQDKKISKSESDFENIKKYIYSFTHPIFANADDVTSKGEVAYVTPACNISTSELAHAMSFPKKSVQGLSAIECCAFGRNVIYRNSEITNSAQPDIELGCVSHMLQNEDQNKVNLNVKSFASHTFITGSTGSGKSNTIYTMLDKLVEDDKTKFLVIEPAKGEYKDIFGGRDNVSVFGTNPKKAPLLRINPFSFPDDIHILEHIDRLVEIFNACWPMYAAMPAILKESIEQAYKSCGWSLTKSVSTTNVFPTFVDLIEQLPKVIESSAYSNDTKGDYIGALITRVRSLTNGIYGQLFCSNAEILNSELFNNNVIVDLSRVGSMETKSLLMGILVMKLQEFRMGEGGMNGDLRHITVLEEAHNLLRRTSTDQSQESSNLQGKSVEMLANAIAEMRTYGEGFIIADQSPGLLDMSVIRNTNTKIIMRLPDESDRMLVGKATGLNNEQIIELSRLKVGVAAVYQNNWVEPVLCAVNEFENECKKVFTYACKDDILFCAKEKFFLNLLDIKDSNDLTKEEVEAISKWINEINIGKNTKMHLNKALGKSKLNEKEKIQILYNIFEGKRLAQIFMNSEQENSYIQVCENIIETHNIENADLLHRIIHLIFIEISNNTAQVNFNERFSKCHEFESEKGGVQ